MKKNKNNKKQKKQNKATYVLDMLHYTTFDTRAYMRIYTAHDQCLITHARYYILTTYKSYL